MTGTFRRLRLAVLLAAAASMGAGCDRHDDASIVGQLQVTLPSAAAKDDVDAVGTDQTIEDSELATKVREAMRADPQLQSQDVDVAVKDGAVILTGMVDSPLHRERAIRLADSVTGVAQVQDRLKVRP